MDSKALSSWNINVSSVASVCFVSFWNVTPWYPLYSVSSADLFSFFLKCSWDNAYQSVITKNIYQNIVVVCFQYYFYEFAEDGEDLHAKRPRQCLPYALLSFTFVNPSRSLDLSVGQVSGLASSGKHVHCYLQKECIEKE